MEKPDPEPSTAHTSTGSGSVPECFLAKRESLSWELVKSSTDPADPEAYLKRYPDGAYEVLTRNRVRRLGRSEAPPHPVALEAPPKPPLSVEAGLKLSRSDLPLIQLGPAAEGFDPGPGDGLFGRGTREVIEQWQGSRGEAVTGYLDVQSAQVLLVSVSVAGG